jgi:hypothetical protein
MRSVVNDFVFPGASIDGQEKKLMQEIIEGSKKKLMGNDES